MSKLFGIKDRPPTLDETRDIASYKNIIYEGFKKALSQGVPRDKAGILVDEQFGSAILDDARKNGITFACPAEKSGQDEFDFEFGPEYSAHIERFKPSFVKVLVRYNPDDDAALNTRQARRLKQLSDYCQKSGTKFLFELLVPATKNQLAQLGGDKKKFDSDVRPGLMVASIDALVKAGVEPDVWKIEGLEKRSDCELVAKKCREGGRTGVGVVILGRGEDDTKVQHWIAQAKGVPGFIGFAVGRTIFWDALSQLKAGTLTREQAVGKISENYLRLYKLWG